MSQICIKCVKDKNLKKLITRSGSLVSCELCGETHLSMDSLNNDFFALVKATVRFNYSEWDYNTHWGGDGYESLFYGEDNIFFFQERALSQELYEELALSITDGPVYEDYDKGISIFSGYDEDGNQNMLLASVKSSLDSNIENLAIKLESENYFKVEAELQNILTKYIKVAEKNLEPASSFYRARIGFSDKQRNFGGGFEAEYHYKPYSIEEIGAPPPRIAGAGRINRPGVSFFYCATNIYTAVSEIRPHPGDRVSIGKFKLKKTAKIFNLSEDQLLHYSSSDKSLDSYIPLNTLSVFMNKVIPPSERQQYSFTQLLADCIRQLGFDGIIFNSTVGDGENIVLFDPSIVTYTEDEAAVVEVEELQYKFKPTPIISDEGIYSPDYIVK